MSETPEDQMKKATEAVSGAKPPTPPTPPPAKPVAAPKPPGIGNIAAGISPAARQQTKFETPKIADKFEGYDVAFDFAFIGAGQGGGRIANAFHNLGYQRVAVFNTTQQDFADIGDDVAKHSLEVGGASKNPEFAKQALSGRKEEVRDLMTRAWGSQLDYALVCVGLGGGTGSGSAATLVEMARQYMRDQGKEERVGAVVSLPPVTEGYQVAQNAVNGFRELTDLGVSPLIVIDNARIDQLYKPAMSQRNAVANETISQLFHLFNQLAAVHSPYVTFDRSELAQLLDSGLVVFGAADIPTDSLQSPADVSTAIRDNLSQTVLADVDLSTGKKAACLFVGSQSVLDSLPMEYFDAGFTQMDRTMGEGSVVHRGVYLGAGEGLQAYTMVSELDIPRDRLLELAKKGGMNSSGGGSIASYLGVD